ncbi:MAG: ribosome silencing factor [Planctomycetota bacterium]
MTARDESAQGFAIEAARTLEDAKCEDIVVLDIRALSDVTDFVVIGTGTSDRQMRSAIEDVREAGERMGHGAYRSSEDERAVWLLADFVNVVVHLFEPNTRTYYDLEMLWGDADRVVWSRDGNEHERNLAGLRPDERLGAGDPQ